MENNMLCSISGRACLLLTFFLVSVTSLHLHLKEPDTLDETLDRLIKQAEASGINKTILQTKYQNDSQIVYLGAPPTDKPKSLDDIQNESKQAPADQQNKKYDEISKEKENGSKENIMYESRRASQLGALSPGHHKEYTETIDGAYSIEIEPIIEDTSTQNFKMRNGSTGNLSFERETTSRNGFMSYEDHSDQKDGPVLHKNPEKLIQILKELEAETLLSETNAVHTENVRTESFSTNKKVENTIFENEMNTHYLNLEDLKRIKELLVASKEQKMHKKDIKDSESNRTEMVRVTDEDLMKAYLNWLDNRKQEELTYSTVNGPLEKTSTDIASPVTIPEFASNPISIASIAARLTAMHIPTRTVINTQQHSLLNRRPCRTCPVLTPLLHTAQNWRYNQFRTNRIINRVYHPHARRTFCATCRK